MTATVIAPLTMRLTADACRHFKKHSRTQLNSLLMLVLEIPSWIHHAHTHARSESQTMTGMQFPAMQTKSAIPREAKLWSQQSKLCQTWDWLPIVCNTINITCAVIHYVGMVHIAWNASYQHSEWRCSTQHHAMNNYKGTLVATPCNKCQKLQLWTRTWPKRQDVHMCAALLSASSNSSVRRLAIQLITLQSLN